MGEVYLARDTKLGRRVAIKFLHTQDPALVQRFVLEARATARCGHENIVTLYEADTFEGRPYMALEYLQGNTLADLMAGGKPMPPSRAVELVSPILRALACAHGQGIVHRDLKPENVVLTDSGVMKVLDFGIAKVLAGEPRALRPGKAAEPGGRGKVQPPAGQKAPSARAALSALTEHGTTLGTLAYMSPEQWKAEVVDHRTDIWAVGIMLFHMLTGKHPLSGVDGMQLGEVVVSAEPMPSVGSAAQGVPGPLAAAVDACLAKDREKRPGSALTLLKALEPFLPGRLHRELTVDESPYAGLSPFQESNADRFFGRTHEVAAVVHRLRDQPLLAVVGPSGVGKSSFVRAGVVPALKRLGESWEALVVRPGRNPLAALASSLSGLKEAAISGGTASEEVSQEQDLVARLAAEPGYAGSLLRAHARRTRRKVLLFVDQFEEIYTLVPEARERLAFTGCLSGIADDAASPVRLVLSVRSDFLERVFEDSRFTAELRQGLFFLTTPSDEGLRDALTLPAEMAGYRFEEPALVEDLVRDLRSTHGALSLLQFAATQLWEARDSANKVLTRASYDAIGGIAGALARYADRVLEELSPEARAGARDLFLRLVTRERTRAVVSLEELLQSSARSGALEQLVEQLVQARLLVVQKNDRGSTVEIVHESLIGSWPTLRRWLDESGEDAQFLEQLRAGAKQWEAASRRRDLLWRDEIAEEARRFRRRFQGELPDPQHSFLAAVLAEEARVARRKRALVAGGIGFLSLLVAGSLIALVIIRDAHKEAVRQTGIARSAEGAARHRAEELQKKERERAEAAQRAEKASAELRVKNDELVTALGTAEEARRHATLAQGQAERSAAAARREQERADRAAQELAARLREEKERVRRLQTQFGSSMADTLPR
jgi:serine/threonine protein kinase